MVIPRLERQAGLGEPLQVYGDGTQTRCFCHVLDVVDGLLRLLDDPRAIGEVFNLGSQEEVSILELARRIIELTASSSSIQLVPYEEAYAAGFEDMQRRMPDTSKVTALTGWSPTRTLRDVLVETIAEARAENSIRTVS
jgi:UDP-glucose 4-epimerase